MSDPEARGIVVPHVYVVPCTMQYIFCIPMPVLCIRSLIECTGANNACIGMLRTCSAMKDAVFGLVVTLHCIAFVVHC